MPSNVSLGKNFTLNFLSLFGILLSSMSGSIESPSMRVVVLLQCSRFSFELGAIQAFFIWVISLDVPDKIVLYDGVVFPYPFFFTLHLNHYNITTIIVFGFYGIFILS